MYTLPSLYDHAYTVPNAPSLQYSVYKHTISIYWEQFYSANMVSLYSNIVLYSNYNICGRYLIIVLVRDINHVFSYSYSLLKVTPVLLVSYSYDYLVIVMINQNNTSSWGTTHSHSDLLTSIVTSPCLHDIIMSLVIDCIVAPLMKHSNMV